MFYYITVISIVAYLSITKNKPTVSTMEKITFSGTILRKYDQEIPSKAKGKASRHEARFLIHVEKKIQANELQEEEEVAGNIELLHQFEIGNKVTVVCTTATGRKIETITKNE
jgi:hypothetical protein